MRWQSGKSVKSANKHCDSNNAGRDKREGQMGMGMGIRMGIGMKLRMGIWMRQAMATAPTE